MKKYIYVVILLILAISSLNAAWVRVKCYGSVQAFAIVEIQDGNNNIIGTSGPNPYYTIINSNPNNPTEVDFEVNASLSNTWVRVKGYEAAPQPHNCNITEWKSGSWSGAGTQLSPYVFSEIMPLDLDCYDIKITTYGNIDRVSSITLSYDGTNTPSGNSYTMPIASENDVSFAKGWQVHEWTDLPSPSFDGPSSWTITITEKGVNNEEYTTIINGLDSTGPPLNYYMINPCPKFCFENKPLNYKWNWESFPMNIANSPFSNNNSMNFIPSFTNNIDPDEFEWMTVDGSGVNDLSYDYPTWNLTTYYLRSSDAVKIQIDSSPERSYIADGNRVLSTTSISLQEGWNWIGYWLPVGQNCDDAFGDNWDDVNIIKAEDWYYDDQTSGRNLGRSTPISTLPKPMHYGEGYMVKMHEAVTLTWEPADNRDNLSYNNFNRPEPQYFDFETKADYEVIDIIDVPQNISEIGVFVDDICVGAVVVQDSSAQVLLYTDSINRSPSPFSFQVVSGRGNSASILSYEVYNDRTGRFEPGVVLSQSQGYSVVMLGKEGEPFNDVPIVKDALLHGNYPNPFNPVTSIMFSLPAEQEIELIVYNMKGQVVRNLIQGLFNTGDHSMIWNGKDNNGKSVSSGLYFYKLITAEQNISKKMLLLK